MRSICIIASLVTLPFLLFAQQHSVAREWNEILLNAIRRDFARPTVHARNLFHTSIAMYDAWAAYDTQASTYFLNHQFRLFYCPFEGIERPSTQEAIRDAREEALSYAVYRLLSHRFENSPGVAASQREFDFLMQRLGYDKNFTSTDYSQGEPAALGNYIAEQLIAFGLQDGANEQHDYANRFYEPVNEGMFIYRWGNEFLSHPNRWQPLNVEGFVGQSGIPEDSPPPFLSPEWGSVVPFALQQEALKIKKRDGQTYWVYHDPGMPPQIDLEKGGEEYLWNFALVALWGAQLDPGDSVKVDISPASMGNIQAFPDAAAMHEFYDLLEGGDPGKGYSVNPKTGMPYEEQLVPRGDYARVLAEFWADGPDSETPPGHWFTILNAINDHPELNKKIAGEGQTLDALEWDVKAYLTLGGAVHDAAISAWGIKGYYDYIRPVSAIRAMAARGQSSDPKLPNYHPAGIPLIPGFIEVVQPNDSILKIYGEGIIHRIKLKSWRGPLFIDNPRTDMAGVGWVLAEEWWPYQRPNFVTPPFAGYVSGHSTFSRAAAEVLIHLTGDEYFPGGMSEFQVRKNEFLVFEEGPSVDMTLQWAKYQDAADQCSLSRIWGGIHPPADDMPGRKIGEKVGLAAFEHAMRYFNGEVRAEAEPAQVNQLLLYPNPIAGHQDLILKPQQFVLEGQVEIINAQGQMVLKQNVQAEATGLFRVSRNSLTEGMYFLRFRSEEIQATKRFVVK